MREKRKERKKRGRVRVRVSRWKGGERNAFCLNASATPAPHLPLVLQASVFIDRTG